MGSTLRVILAVLLLPVMALTRAYFLLWFTGAWSISVAARNITEFSIPTTNSSSVGITAGPDGALWFTESAGNIIGMITTAGAVSEFSVPD